jgi:hydrogenase/urease accessory protein HupE
LGGGREVALAALLVARLSQGVASGEALPPADRATRATAAKVWLASLALPAATRVPFARCVEATTGTTLQVAGALRALVAAAGAHLDGPSVQELEKLARQLAAT